MAMDKKIKAKTKIKTPHGDDMDYVVKPLSERKPESKTTKALKKEVEKKPIVKKGKK